MVIPVARKGELLQWILGGILLVALVFSAVISTSFFADDLAFDFAGYAIRYTTTFAGWFPGHHFGVPTATFDPWIPALLPLLFRAVGFGTFTAPLALSILIARLALVIAIIFLYRSYKIKTATGFFVGALVAINPITFKFLNRYYELVAWVFFILALVFLFRFFRENKTKNLIPSVFLAALVILSHQIPAVFLALSVLFIAFPKIRDLKKVVLFAALTLGLSLFWVGPFFFFLGSSSLNNDTASLLSTPGITASSIILIFLLALFSFSAYRVRLSKKYPRETRLLFATFLLSIIKFLFPQAPILTKIFTHSFHVFYLIVLVLIAPLLITTQKNNHTFLKKTGVILLIVSIFSGAFFLPKIWSNYTFVEPRYATITVDGMPIGHEELDNAFSALPAYTRAGMSPANPVIAAFAANRYPALLVGGWGYNGVALANSREKETRLAALLERDCSAFTETAKKWGVGAWIVLSDAYAEPLVRCGWIQSPESPLLLFSPQPVSLVEHGELISFSPTEITLKVFPPTTLLKVNFFPRWGAFPEQGTVKIARDAETAFMRIISDEETIVVIRYLPTTSDAASALLSSIFLLVLVGFGVHSIRQG